MPSCNGCGKDLSEVSRKAVKEKGAKARKLFDVSYRCGNSTCKDKGRDKHFLDDGLMVIPLND